MAHTPALEDAGLSMTRLRIEVAHGDALAFKADVLALKFAQAAHGVDALAAESLRRARREVRYPKVWKSVIVDATSSSPVGKVLFMGVPTLHAFGYREIRRFGREVLESLHELAPGVEHLAITVHGPGYGLDEAEAFESEIAGFSDAVREGMFPASLRLITVVESNKKRADRLTTLLSELLIGGMLTGPALGTGRKPKPIPDERLRSAGYGSESKGHVFVAMPFKDEMEDVFHFGIRKPVRTAGLLCERADLSAFTGDVLEWVRTRIKTASLVVADLTDANPNVYLEVGYAWGCGVPTVLLVRDSQELKFDVRGQRCLIYKKIKDLEAMLRTELAGLKRKS